MNLKLRVLPLLLIFLPMLTACAAPASMASAPTIIPAPRTIQQAVEAAPTDRVELAAGRYQLIMFYSPIWATCREVAPIVNGLMKNYTDRVRFVRVNIRHPQAAELQAQLGFSATPEFYLIDPQGRVERKWDESVDVDELEQTIRALSPTPWKIADQQIRREFAELFMPSRAWQNT